MRGSKLHFTDEKDNNILLCAPLQSVSISGSFTSLSGTAAVSALSSSRYWSSEEANYASRFVCRYNSAVQKPDRYPLASRKTETRSFKLTFIRRPYDLDPGTLIKVSSSCVWKENKFCPNRIQ